MRDNDTHKDSLFFPIGPAITIQHEDGGPWMHGVIKEAINSDHNGRFFIIRVTKTGRLIMQNTRHICSTPITTEQYLLEHIKNGTGQFEDIFTKTISVKHGRMFKSYTAEPQMHMAHNER